MKTIFISIPYGMSGRNILRSKIFEILRNNLYVVILSPLSNDGNFRKEFGGENVAFEDLPKNFTLFFKLYRYLLDIIEGYYFTKKTGIETLLILKECLRREKFMVYLFRISLGKICSLSFGIIKLMQNLQFLFMRNRYYESLFDKFRPSLVFLTHPLCLEEFPLAFYARSRKIPVVAMIHSWDNITAKSGLRMVTNNKPGRMLPIKFDKVIVWNKIMERELIEYYGYSSKNIFIGGIPQFDSYINNGFPSKDIVFKKIGADINKKLILYACGSPFMLPRQMEIIDILAKALEEREFVYPSQLLIRTHPGTDMKELKNKFSKNTDILFNEADISNAALRFSVGWQNNKISLREIIYYSDVTINVASTMTIDAAMLDKPIICIGFDGYRNNPYYNSILKHYDFTHYKPIMQSGGVKLAKNPQELIRFINDYLENPSLDSEGRRKIREQQCYYLDGKSGERIGNFIIDFLNGRK